MLIKSQVRDIYALLFVTMAAISTSHEPAERDHPVIDTLSQEQYDRSPAVLRTSNRTSDEPIDDAAQDAKPLAPNDGRVPAADIGTVKHEQNPALPSSYFLAATSARAPAAAAAASGAGAAAQPPPRASASTTARPAAGLALGSSGAAPTVDADFVGSVDFWKTWNQRRRKGCDEQGKCTCFEGVGSLF